MDRDRRLVGLIYTVLSLILTPIYMKIIHILVWNKEFRKLRCYQIMAQIGIIDCVFVLGYAVFGLTLTFKSMFHGFTHVVLQLLEAVWMAKVSLNVVLAINRLTVTFSMWRMPGWLHWIQILYCWLLGLFYFVICLTPHTGIAVNFDFFGWGYDAQKPWTGVMRIVDITYATVAMVLGFIMYLIAALVLFTKRRKYSTNSGSFRIESRICIVAVVLFSSPMMGDFLWNFAFDFLPKTYWTTSIISVFSICNIALAAPTVYLIVNRSLRTIFFKSGILGYKKPKISAINLVPMKTSVASVTRISRKPYAKRFSKVALS
ncbi:hypothetical protein QR680_011795 [Steinernema hermaphroditum]|uniref:7TM GPCR serpentine receptor class x (Srx) domain-containing protein n=1 Tax=Steinernema hermaphroditum TaxID=289476 RepID=A0AA39I2F0_9BILA|nr:hypothetical protein QR680_011795 [Steinernema hermaphroditum]